MVCLIKFMTLQMLCRQFARWAGLLSCLNNFLSIHYIVLMFLEQSELDIVVNTVLWYMVEMTYIIHCEPFWSTPSLLSNLPWKWCDDNVDVGECVAASVCQCHMLQNCVERLGSAGCSWHATVRIISLCKFWYRLPQSIQLLIAKIFSVIFILSK